MVTTKAGAGTGTRVIKLPRNRLAEAAGVLAQAFQDDPIQRYVTPNDARRAHQLPWTFGAAVRYCFPYGAVYSTPNLDGIACWLPPGSSLTNARGMLRSGKIFAPVWLGPAAFTRFMGVAAYMTAARAHHAAAALVPARARSRAGAPRWWHRRGAPHARACTSRRKRTTVLSGNAARTQRAVLREMWLRGNQRGRAA